MLFLGDSATGKTSFLQRIRGQAFTVNTEVTLGVDWFFLSKYIGSKAVHLQISDSAGQDKVRTVTRAQMHETMCFMLFCDVTNPDSLASLNSFFEEIENKGPENRVVVVIGNKADQPAIVTEEQIKDFSSMRNCEYFIVSCKNDDGAKLFEPVRRIVEVYEDKYTLPRRASIVSKPVLKEKEEAACFPGDSLVLLENGSRIAISSLEIGDKVCSFNLLQEEVQYSEVYTYGHRNQSILAPFIKIQYQTESLKGSSYLSPQHLIFTLTKLHPFLLNSKPAKHAQKGDIIIKNNGKDIQLATITSVSRETKKGIFNPITTLGTILVDDILASCYCSVPHDVAHLLFSPLRSLHSEQSKAHFARVEGIYWDLIEQLSKIYF
uniref:Hint domain-containing protein n=1 Tax=Arcella intermedia TaxID=1963864 RepID=A0A6B2L6G0_9EUKA